MKMYYTQDELEQAKADAKEASKEHQCVFHVCRYVGLNDTPGYLISDRYDAHNTVISYERGRVRPIWCS